MKSFLSLFFGLALIFTSCERNNGFDEIELSVLTPLKGESGLTYNESLDKWTELKKDNGDSYIYQTNFESWAGFGSTTELKVIDNKVVSRIYKEYGTHDKTGERTITDAYIESEDALGSHEKGALPLTIDELYNSCASDYLIVDEENNTIFFRTEINGLITLCGFFPDGCADDCYEGISIDSFDWID